MSMSYQAVGVAREIDRPVAVHVILDRPPSSRRRSRPCVGARSRAALEAGERERSVAAQRAAQALVRRRVRALDAAERGPPPRGELEPLEGDADGGPTRLLEVPPQHRRAGGRRRPDVECEGDVAALVHQ